MGGGNLTDLRPLQRINGLGISIDLYENQGRLVLVYYSPTVSFVTDELERTSCPYVFKAKDGGDPRYLSPVSTPLIVSDDIWTYVTTRHTPMVGPSRL